MQVSARTCGRSAADKGKAIYFNHPSQGNSTNCYIILGPRRKTAPPANQQIGQFPPKRVSEVSTGSSVFPFSFFLIHRRALFALNQSEAMFAELGEYSKNMLSEAFWTPNIASSQFDEQPELGWRSKSSSN